MPGSASIASRLGDDASERFRQTAGSGRGSSNNLFQPCPDLFQGEGRARIVHRRIKRALEQLPPKIDMRFQVSMFAENDEHGFARIDKHAALHEIEYPGGQFRRQVGFKAKPSFARLFLQRCGLSDILRPFASRLASPLSSSSDPLKAYPRQRFGSAWRRIAAHRPSACQSPASP